MDSFLFARIDHILEERHGLIKNSELAQILNYNDSYLGKIVKKFTSVSLYDYRMSFTMAYAANLLKNTNKKVADIALELQFTNRTQFYKIFSKHYGMTPKEYRTNCHSTQNI